MLSWHSGSLSTVDTTKSRGSLLLCGAIEAHGSLVLHDTLGVGGSLFHSGAFSPCGSLVVAGTLAALWFTSLRWCYQV